MGLERLNRCPVGSCVLRLVGYAAILHALLLRGHKKDDWDTGWLILSERCLRESRTRTPGRVTAGRIGYSVEREGVRKEGWRNKMLNEGPSTVYSREYSAKQGRGRRVIAGYWTDFGYRVPRPFGRSWHNLTCAYVEDCALC